MNDKLDALQAALPRLAEGLEVTLKLTLGGAVLAFVISVVFGLLSISPVGPLRWLATIVVEFFRGTSLVVQLFWLFYVMPQLGVSMDAVWTGILALGLNYGAYGAEVVRGSINSVDKGQWEGAIALNMSGLTRMRRVIWPQAWALMLSGYNNLLIMLIKGTPAVTFITLHEMFYEVLQLRRDTGSTIFAFSVGLLLYYLYALGFAKGMRLLEKRAFRRLGITPRSSHAGAGAAL